MSKEKLWKQEKGSIAVFAIATVFSLIFILGGVFAASTSNRKNQLRTLLKIKEIYLKPVEIERVARIETTEYRTLQSAIDSIENSEETTVYLLKDIKENVTIPQNINIVLDMGGHRIEEGNSEEPTISLKGTLKLNEGTIASISNDAVDNYGTIEMEGGALISENENGLSNRSGATAKIAGGTISSKNTVGLYNRSGATATITGGEVTSTYSNAITNSGTIEISETAKISNNGTREDGTGSLPCLSNRKGATAMISGGTITSENARGINNQSGATATITGGEVTSTYSNAIANSGTIEISGTAKISNIGVDENNTSTNVPCLSNQTGGQMTISGGTITSEKESGLLNQSEATVTITGGEIRTKYKNAINNQGIIEIEGGTIYAEKNVGLYNNVGATATITGGEIRQESGNAIRNFGKIEISGTAKICNDGKQEDGGDYPSLLNESGAIVTISGGAISSEYSSGLSNRSGGTVTITGGTFTTKSSSFYAIYNAGTVTSITGATISGKTYGI